MMHHCEKHYPHSLGLSACFRQWRATSHCSKLHGYALAFTFYFEAPALDHNNWVLDFGSMKPVKAWLEQTFDHKLIVATDDPLKGSLLSLDELGLAQVHVLDSTGCEAFAELAYKFCEGWLEREGHSPRVRLAKVTCAEHEGNSASYSFL